MAGYTQDDVAKAIASVTKDPREQAAMWFMCGAESGCDPNARQTGGGPGRGAWQIETTWNPESRSLNPYSAAQDLYTRWNVPGCTQQQGALWNTNPSQAAFQAARCIGKAGSPYGQAQQATGWGMVLAHVPAFIGNAVNSGDPLGGLPVIGGVTSGIGAIGDAIGTLFDANTWIRAALVAGGLLMVIIGAGFAVKETPPVREARSAATTAALAA